VGGECGSATESPITTYPNLKHTGKELGATDRVDAGLYGVVGKTVDAIETSVTNHPTL